MAESRQLWTGPFGAALADRATELVPVEPAGLWVVVSALARRRVLGRLGRRRGVLRRPRVWPWADLWREVRARADGGPLCLAPAGVLAVLDEAIGRARRDRAIARLRPVVDAPGYRRRLRGRFAAWTRAERDPGGD